MTQNSILESIKEIFLKANVVQVTVFCAVVYFSYLLIFLYFTDFIVCSAINFGDKFVDRSQLPGLCSLTVSPGGYDGQFFYRLALDPLLINEQNFGVVLDNAPYRQQRILYPAIVHILSYNKPAWVPYIMVAINYCAICGITFFVAKLLQKFETIPVYACVVALYPGFAVSISRNLSEPLSIFFIVVCLYCLFNSRHLLASICLCLAVLSRETALVVAIVGGLVWLLQHFSDKIKISFPRITISFWLLPLAVYLSWQSYIYYRWGVPGFEQGAAMTGLPLSGIIKALSDFQYGYWLDWLLTLEMLWIAIFFLYLLLYTAMDPPFIRYLWVGYGMLAISLSHLVWRNHFSFFRVLSEFHLFGLLILVLSQARYKLIFAIGWIGLWLSTAVIETSISYNIWLQNTLE